MRVLTWNILHGGGPKRVPEIILSLLSHRPDVVVLTEFRSTRGSQVRAVMADHGLEFQLASPPDERRNGILVAARVPVVEEVVADAPGSGRWLGCRLVESGVRVGAVHVPDDTQGAEKTAFWRFLLRVGREWVENRAIFLGDFNTCRRGVDGGSKRQRCEAMLGSFVSLGFEDAWRALHPQEREFSWFSHGGEGWRIDAAYLSVALREMLQTASYSQVERELGHSDHALLTVDLSVEAAGGGGGVGGRHRPVNAGLFGHGGGGGGETK